MIQYLFIFSPTRSTKIHNMEKCGIFSFKACVKAGGLKSNSPRHKKDSSQLNREVH